MFYIIKFYICIRNNLIIWPFNRNKNETKEVNSSIIVYTVRWSIVSDKNCSWYYLRQREFGTLEKIKENSF